MLQTLTRSTGTRAAQTRAMDAAESRHPFGRKCHALRIARSAFWYQGLVDELDKLFSFKGREPLVFVEHYTAGYVAIMRKPSDLLVDE